MCPRESSLLFPLPSGKIFEVIIIVETFRSPRGIFLIGSFGEYRFKNLSLIEGWQVCHGESRCWWTIYAFHEWWLNMGGSRKSFFMVADLCTVGCLALSSVYLLDTSRYHSPPLYDPRKYVQILQMFPRGGDWSLLLQARQGYHKFLLDSVPIKIWLCGWGRVGMASRYCQSGSGNKIRLM